MIEHVCIFDIESTGLDIENDRILTLAIEKLEIGSGKSTFHEFKFNPQDREINPEAQAIHGISIEDVKNSPTFESMAAEVFAIFKGCHIGGYNIMRFDIPMLAFELRRAGINFRKEFKGMVLDGYANECQINKRDLASVYEKYTGQKLIGAHDARNDVEATTAILESQISEIVVQSNPPLWSEECIKEMHRISGYDKIIDYGGYIQKVDGEYVYAFGRHKGERVIDQVGFAQWMLDKDFPQTTKDWINYILKQSNGNQTTVQGNGH